MANNPSVQCSDGRGNPGSPKRPAPAAPSMKIENTPTSGAESDDHIIYMDDDVEMGDANVPLNMDWSAQGAIPKGIQCTSEGQFMQSGKNGDALPGEHDRIKIENSWGELKVTVKLKTGYFTVDAAPYIHPCIMQHMVKSPMLKSRMRLTKIKEMNTTKAGHFVIQDIDCQNIVSRETLQKEIVESFQKIVQGNICVVEDILQVKGGFLEKLLKLYSLPSVSSGVVSVFKCLNKDGFIVVGMQGDVHEVQEAMVRNDEKAVRYVHVKFDEDSMQLIQKLDFIEHLQKMQLHVDIAPLENDRTVLEFSGDDIDLLDKAVEEWNMFSRRIIIRTVHLPVGGKRLLLHQSSEALKYIYSQLNANGISAYVKVGTLALFVMCLSEKAVNAAENVMEKCIIGKEVSRNFFHSDIAKTFLQSHGGKIVIAGNDGTLCFTNDIQQELNVILKDIEKPKLSTIQKKLDRNSVHVLQKLDFQQHLNQKNLKVKFGVTIDDPCIIELKGLIQEEVDQASEDVHLFLNFVLMKKEVELSPYAIALLCHENRKAYEYVERRFHACNVKYCFTAGKEVFVWSTDQNGLLAAEKIMTESFISTKIKGIYFENAEGNDVLNNNVGVISKSHEDADIICLCFTANMKKTVDAVIEKGSTIFSCLCESYLEDFLKKHGRPIVEEIENEFKLHISFRDGRCFFDCDPKTGKQAKDALKSKVKKCKLDIDYSSELMDYLSSGEGKTDIDQVTEQTRCCWNIDKQVIDDVYDETMDTMIGCKKYATWIFGDSARSLSVVEVDYSAVQMDLLVYPVNDSMFGIPVYLNDIEKAGSSTLHSKFMRIRSTGKAALGEIHLMMDTDMGQLKCKGVAAVVIACSKFCEKSKQMTMKFQSMDEFSTSILKVLNEADKNQAKSVGIPLPSENLTKEFAFKSCTKIIVQTVIKYFVQKSQTSSIQNVFLCCKGSDSIKSILKNTNKVVNSELSRGILSDVRRKLFCDIEDIFQMPSVKVKVECESIFTVKADCLALAVSPDLTLSKGYLTNELSNMAGSEFQKRLLECHPNKLQPWEIVMMDLGKCSSNRAKKVIFGYILKWKNVQDIKGVQQIVRDCLFSAERASCTSIAFPALGTGNLEYPQRDVAKAMFDAVEQYKMETMLGKLKTVIFTVYSKANDPTRDVFCDEEARRKRLKERNITQQTPKGFPFLRGSKPVSKSVEIKVMEKRFLQHPLPPEYVDIKLKLVSKVDTGQSRIKRSSEGDWTWTDQIEVLTNTQQNLGKAVKKALNHCLLEKVTGVVLHTSHEYQFSVGDQVEEMVNAVTSISGNSYLQHVVITTVDYTGFINAEEKLLQTQQDNRWFPTLRSSKPVWLRVYAEGKPQGTISIQLIGLNENELEEAKMKIQKLAKNKVSHEMLKHSIAEESAVDEEEKIDDADVCILGDVTAEVNPGIVNYQKKSSEVFTLWKKQIESHFKIKFLDEKEKLKISGSLKSIMKVEQYLDNDFPTLLDDKNEEMLQSIGQSEINPVVDYYEYPQHKFEVEFTQQEKEAFALFQDDFSAITEQIQRFTWKENIMEITCDQKYEAEVHQKIEKLKKKINEDLRTDEIILNGNETEHMENACKTTHLQFNSVLILTDQNRIKMMALDYETLNKAKISILIGIKRLKSSEHHKRKIIEPETQMQNEDKTNKTDWSKSDTTLVYERNGISVLIYVSDIMTAIVEGIVSSSNPNLLPIGGVAKKISDAADKEFVEECRQIVSANGHLATSECRVTSAGHLKYKNVLHVVVPVKEYGERGEALHGKLQKLSLAVLNCLQKAETCGLSSVALPCLGAGNSGFPIDLCAQEYYRALQSFGKARRSSKKMEVHFVDIDPQNIQKVKAMFGILSKQSNPTEKKIGQFTPQPESKPSSPESEVSRSSIQNRCLSNTINTSLGVKSCSEFSWPSGKVKVYVVEGDITRVNTEAIVSTESKNFDGNGAIARQIMDLAGEKHRTSYNWEKSVKHSSTDVIAIPVDGQMMCRYVLHAISPHWTCSYCQQNQAFSSDISLTVQNILMKASELDIQSVAIPFFGTSDDEEKRPTPVQTCCGAIVDGILQFIDPRRTPSSAKNSIVEVCLISTDPVVVYQWIEHIQNSNRGDYQQLVQHQALQHVSCKILESAV